MLKQKSQKTRPDLPETPARMRSLPVNAAGYPVPWFVAWVNGQPEFRCIAPGRIEAALKRKLCWLCGKSMGAESAFVIGPMCALNRTNAEPPSHRACAIYAAMACPFLTRPAAERREGGMPTDTTEPAGFAIKRNPGACAVWITERFTLFEDHLGGLLINIGEPKQVLWFCEGREATRAEVQRSIETGLPILEEQARLGGPQSLRALEEYRQRVMELIPAA